MLRKILPLLFLLIFVSSDTAHGWRHGRRCRRSRCCCCVPCPPHGDTYCLQYDWDFFGEGDDIYDVIVHVGGCLNDPLGHDDLYFGSQSTQSLPQSCYGPIPCETARKKVGAVSGHEQYPPSNPHAPFRDKAEAAAFMDKRPEDCTYIKIHHDSLHEDIYAVVFKVPARGRFDYFGVQVDFPSAPEPDHTPTINSRPKKVRDAILYFKDSRANKKYAIWLK